MEAKNLQNQTNIVSVNKELIVPLHEEISENERSAKVLSALWEEYREKNKDVSQTSFAKEKFGWSQGLFSQYLTGKVPISLKNAIKFSEVFNCSPGDIRSEFKDQKTLKENKDLKKQLEESKKYLAEIKEIMEETNLGQKSETDKKKKIVLKKIEDFLSN